jgi:DNA repair protein RadC
MIVFHNHPSGNLKPSTQDDSITRKIKSAAEIFDIRLDDHIIISDTGYYSYNDEGRL